ncbi:MAG TPA: FeoB-associated Cys-rich membrane protein [Desulfosporosinus sp.]|nr:FeoB-associated Cys-rich membrane protein [Desulfosporosinus sp.]
MSMVDFIVIGVVAGLLALAIYKIVRDKKRGVKCSGCGGCSGCPDKNLQ